MTRSSRRDWSSTVADIRRFNAACRAGGPDALRAFADLASRLFCLTVGDPRKGAVHVEHGERRGHGTVAGGYGKGEEAIALANGYFLVLTVALYINEAKPDGYLRASLSKYQYQTDRPGKNNWIFRYEYKRDPGDSRHPAAHLHVNGDPRCGDMKCGRELRAIHFYTGRPTVESTIRLLIEQFEVPANSPAEIWRPALEESERGFLDVAHRPALGPGGSAGTD